MEDKTGSKQEDKKEYCGGNGYCLIDERTLNLLLYGSREVRVIDVQKLKRKVEDEQGGSSSKKQNNTDDHEKPRLTNAIRSFPDEVHLCRSSIPGAGYGVCAKEHIPLGTWIGPYEGSRLPARNFPSNYETGYLWEIYKDGRLSHYIDGRDEDNSSWMRFIQCARHVKEQNLYAFQYCGNIFYRAFKEVPPGTELLVWYDEKYPQFLGIPLGIQDYEFFRESVSSSNTQSSPVCSSASLFVDPVTRYPKTHGFQESHDNPNTGSFRFPLPREPPPRFVRPSSSAGNVFPRDKHGTSGIRGGPSFAAGSVESKMIETDLTATTTVDGQFFRNFSQIPAPSGNNFYSPQIKNKYSQEKVVKTENSTRGYMSDKHWERQRDEDPLSNNERRLPAKINALREMPPLQFFDSEY